MTDTARGANPKVDPSTPASSAQPPGQHSRDPLITHYGITGRQYTESSPLETALSLAGSGYVVGQVYEMLEGRCSCGDPNCRTPGKHPINGDTRSTTDPATIQRWWSQRPGAGVFVNLARTGLVDISSDSEQALVSFRKRGLPPTTSWESGSGRGHEHHLYRLSPDAPQIRQCRSGEFDLMSAGIAVVPPSVSGKGSYRWLAGPVSVADLPDAPAWIVQALVEHDQRDSDAGIDPSEPPIRLTGDALLRWRGELVARKDDGEIDQSKTLTDIANDLARAGLSAYGIDRMLRDRAEVLGLDKYLNRRDEDRRFAALATSAVEMFGRAGNEATHDRFRLLSVDEVLDRPDPVWIVDSLLQANSTTMLFGPYASYKSFAALGLAIAITQGLPWLGFQVREPGPVVYVVAEGIDSFKLRIEAVQKELGLTRDDLRGKLFLLDHAIYVDDPLDVEGLLSSISALELPEPPRLVVLDTLARTMGPGKRENLQEDMGDYVIGMDRFRTALEGSAVLTVHHTNKDGGPRGSTVLPGAMSTNIEIKAEGPKVTLYLEKQKDGQGGLAIHAERVIVDLSPPPSLTQPLVLNRTSVVLRKAEREVEAGPAMGANTRRAGIALFEEPEGWLSATRWQAASGISAASSFEKARKELFSLGLVVNTALARNTSHYELTEKGREVFEALTTPVRDTASVLGVKSPSAPSEGLVRDDPPPRSRSPS